MLPEANSSLKSLPEEISCCSPSRRKVDVSPESVAESLSLLGPAPNCNVRCQRTAAWESPVHCTKLFPDQENRPVNNSCCLRPGELPSVRQLLQHNGLHEDNEAKDVAGEAGMTVNGNVFAPPPRQVDVCAPPPKSAAGARQSPHERAHTMVPMLRARHMKLLDDQYLNDRDVRMVGADENRRRSNSRCGPSCAPAQRRKSRFSLPIDIQRGSAAEASAKRPPSGSSGSQSHRARPKVVMPPVKGQIKTQAESAQRELDIGVCAMNRMKSKGRLRSRSGATPRPKSQARSSRPVSNHWK